MNDYERYDFWHREIDQEMKKRRQMFGGNLKSATFEKEKRNRLLTHKTHTDGKLICEGEEIGARQDDQG
jgi:hypothetical protein